MHLLVQLVLGGFGVFALAGSGAALYKLVGSDVRYARHALGPAPLAELYGTARLDAWEAEVRRRTAPYDPVEEAQRAYERGEVDVDELEDRLDVALGIRHGTIPRSVRAAVESVDPVPWDPAFTRHVERELALDVDGDGRIG